MQVRLLCACCLLLANCKGAESDTPLTPIEANAPEQAPARNGVTKAYRLGPFDVRFEPPGPGWTEDYEPEMNILRFDKQGTLTMLWLTSTCNGACGAVNENLRYAATQTEASLREFRRQLQDVAHVVAADVTWVHPFEQVAPGTWKWELLGPATTFSGESRRVIGIERWQSGWDRILSCLVQIDPVGSADASHLERLCSTLEVRTARR